MHCPIVVLFRWGTWRFHVLAKNIDCYQSNLLRKTSELHFQENSTNTLMISTFNPLPATDRGSKLFSVVDHTIRNPCMCLLHKLVIHFHITHKALKVAGNKILLQRHLTAVCKYRTYRQQCASIGPYCPSPCVLAN
jgi:hypothetical protein